VANGKASGGLGLDGSKQFDNNDVKRGECSGKCKRLPNDNDSVNHLSTGKMACAGQITRKKGDLCPSGRLSANLATLRK
jgi:hypothetical protein